MFDLAKAADDTGRMLRMASMQSSVFFAAPIASV